MTLIKDGVASAYTTRTRDVGSFLHEARISLAPGDAISAANEDLVLDGMTINYITGRAKAKAGDSRCAFVRNVVHNVARTSYGVRMKTHQHTHALRSSLAAHLIRPLHARVVAAAVGEYAAFAQMARRGFDSTLRAADSVLRMVATAYTASCYGCSGITALGYHAGHGIVAVDPRFIPLGTHLFIPGYGPAIAGDTGGAIKGSRIDLGFNSFADAIQFGRREIIVYVVNGRARARH
ncbi:MAG TPA: 3D domain-containing protein [Candidatus Baltobacteraceae bacterium]